MAAVQSTMQDLGGSASSFSLHNVRQDDHYVTLDDFAGQPLLLMFICNHCPYVIHLIDELSVVGNRYQDLGFGVLAISSNDVTLYPQDGPDAMRVFADNHEFEFPYAYDESQSVAQAYGAACTPDFFIYDQFHKLQYRGQMDSSRPSNDEPVTGCDLISALEAVLKGRAVEIKQTPSIGCNIKWKSGNEPSYF